MTAATVPHVGRYRPDIDGLRAIAVLLVVVFHFHLTSASKSGFVGVDVFFVISGYLITRIIREQVAAGRFSITDFWLRRLRRLAPALFVVLVAVMLYGAARLLQGDFNQLMHEVMAAQFYYANIYFWQNVNYFGLQAGNIYLLHTWSLSVEEQFYIVFPLALALVLRRKPGAALPAVLAATVLSFGLNLVMVDIKPQATFYLMPTRAWELLIGALLTWLPMPTKRLTAWLLGLLGAAFIVAAVAGYDDSTRFPGWFALLPTLGAACLLLAGSHTGAMPARLLSWKPLVYIGRLSYSLYLVHWPVNVFAAAELGDGYTLGWRAAMALLCLLLSMLLFHAVEDPIRQRRVLAGNPRFLWGYAAGLVASVGLATASFITHGLPGRLPTEVARLAAYAQDMPDDRCREFDGQLDAARHTLCSLGQADRPPEWLIYGDSHAWAARDAIDGWLKASGSAGRFAFLNSCPPIKEVYLFRGRELCRSLNEQMLALAAQDDRVKKVFLVSAWRQAIEGALSEKPDTRSSVDESVAVFERQFDATVRQLKSMGKEVYVWEPLPAARDHVPRRLAQAALRQESVVLDTPLADYRRDFAFFFDALARNKTQIQASFSPSAVLCAQETCAAVRSGNPVYFDNSHLANSGSGFWAKALADQFNR